MEAALTMQCCVSRPSVPRPSQERVHELLAKRGRAMPPMTAGEAANKEPAAGAGAAAATLRRFWPAFRVLLRFGIWRPRKPPWDERWVGHWMQSALEKDKFEDMMRSNHVPWVARKVAMALKSEYQFEQVADGLKVREKLPNGWSEWRVFREGHTFTESLLGLNVVGTYTFCDPRYPGKAVSNNTESMNGSKDHRTTLVFSFDEAQDALRIETVQEEPAPCGYNRTFKRR